MMLTLEGRLSDSLLLTYRAPARSMEGLAPEGLSLVTYGPWAFWNVIAARIERLRPVGLPRIVGPSFHMVGYRLVVRAEVTGRQTVQVLSHVRSDADHLLG